MLDNVYKFPFTYIDKYIFFMWIVYFVLINMREKIFFLHVKKIKQISKTFIANVRIQGY